MGDADVLLGYLGSAPDPAVTLHFDGLTGSGNPIFDGSPVWTFGSAASTTPEPMSIMLLGSGLAGMAVRRRRFGSGQ
jgi:hypothetical protein